MKPSTTKSTRRNIVKKLFIVAGMIGAALSFTHAHAGTRVNADIYIGAPVVYDEPQPVYAPRRVYVQPAPVYVQPAPVYVIPAPVHVQRAPHWRHGHRHGYRQGYRAGYRHGHEHGHAYRDHARHHRHKHAEHVYYGVPRYEERRAEHHWRY
jgi:hypothetical protein